MSLKNKDFDFQGLPFVYTEEIASLITQEDISSVAESVLAQHKHEHVQRIILTIEDGYLGYRLVVVPFGRIRRITGYLTGTTATWNSAKQRELEERVKHQHIVDELQRKE